MVRCIEDGDDVIGEALMTVSIALSINVMGKKHQTIQRLRCGVCGTLAGQVGDAQAAGVVEEVEEVEAVEAVLSLVQTAVGGKKEEGRKGQKQIIRPVGMFQRCVQQLQCRGGTCAGRRRREGAGAYRR